MSIVYSSGNLVFSLALPKSKYTLLHYAFLFCPCWSLQACAVCIDYFYFTHSVKPFSQSAYAAGKPAAAVSSPDMALQAAPPPAWEGRAIATHKLRLVEFSAFMEQQRDADNVRTWLFYHCNATGATLHQTKCILMP